MKRLRRLVKAANSEMASTPSAATPDADKSEGHDQADAASDGGGQRSSAVTSDAATTSQVQHGARGAAWVGPGGGCESRPCARSS